MSENRKQLPGWMNTRDEYEPAEDYAQKPIRILTRVFAAMADLHIPARRRNTDTMAPSEGILAGTALILLLCLQPVRILGILLVALITGYVLKIRKPEWKHLLILPAAVSFLVLFCSLPSVFARPIDRLIPLYRVVKVFGSLEIICIILHTWTWTELTMALGRIFIPSFLIFALDLAGKFIVRCGKMGRDLMQALSVRYVGRSNQQYQTPGGLLGTGLLKSTAQTEQMYQAMTCRGYTPDYKEHK